MNKLSFIVLLLLSLNGMAQKAAGDSLAQGKVTVIKDPRLNELARKETAFNEALALAPRSGRGYRLMLLSTNDRNLAMKVRSQLLQRYPDQKAYSIFQSPYIKLKFGNYLTKPEAEAMRKDIMKNKIVPGNIYIVPETIEIKPEKKEKDSSENE